MDVWHNKNSLKDAVVITCHLLNHKANESMFNQQCRCL